MRPVRYTVAASLDGFIARTDGAFDWIPEDSAVDFAALFAGVDTVLVGRRTWDLVSAAGTPPWARGTRVYVFSRTLAPDALTGATLVSDGAGEIVSRLRSEPGTGEIWLFGGGELFRDLLAAGQVDRVEVTVVPILLGGGVPLLPPGGSGTSLRLLDTRTYPSGMVTLSYAVAAPGA